MCGRGEKICEIVGLASRLREEAVRVWYHSRGRELDVREWRENVACERVV